MRSDPDDEDEDEDGGVTSDGDGPVGSAEAVDQRPRDGGDGGRRGRDVVVPMRLYKTVTVFSTLIAVVCVVLGFVLLDAATFQWTLLRQFVTGLLALFGVAVSREVLSAVLALTGLAVIGIGSGVYVLGTRFRARGMGNSQEDSNEDIGNG